MAPYTALGAQITPPPLFLFMICFYAYFRLEELKIGARIRRIKEKKIREGGICATRAQHGRVPSY